LGKTGRKKKTGEQGNDAGRKQTGTWCIVASGPSLTKADIEKVEGAQIKTIVVNDNYRIAPFALHLYACDPKWWSHWIDDVRAKFKGECWTQDEPTAQRYGIRYIQSVNRAGLSVDSNVIHQGSNSGYQAINLALHLGAQRVLLLGYDCGITNRHIKRGQTHWFGSHPPGLELKSPYNSMRRKFEEMKPERYGLEVINCTRDTTLTCFLRLPIDKAVLL
jgi:hypothetical protein